MVIDLLKEPKGKYLIDKESEKFKHVLFFKSKFNFLNQFLNALIVIPNSKDYFF